MRLNQKYNVLDSLEKITEFDYFLLDDSGKTKFKFMAVDTETNGLKHWKDVVIGISFSVDSKSGFYIPLLSWKNGGLECFWTNKKYSENVTQKEYSAPEWLPQFLKRWLLESGVELLMHNAIFDCLMIDSNFGLDVSSKVFCDTMLLKHVLDENTKCGLKETAIRWQKHLGIPVEELANKEQVELGKSVTKNGGTYNQRTKHIWRADLDILAIYAIADTFLTYGLFEVGLEKFFSEFSEKQWNWFFDEEIMPLCREVIFPMHKRGVQIDVKHFEKLKTETKYKMNELEDSIMQYIEKKRLLEGFSKGKSVEEAVSKKKLIERIIKLENLQYPILKGKPSLAKKAIEAAYNQEPHWLWSYLLGDSEMKYSDEELNQIRNEIFLEAEGRRYVFNLNSDHHLRWLFCDKLGHKQEDLPQTDSGTKEKPIASMKADVLAEYFQDKYPFVKDLLLYKKLEKLYGTYILPALNLNEKGVLYMEWLQHGTVSGRFACSGGYNLQTLPKVEEIDFCSKCESKNLTMEQSIELLADIKCNDCGHVRESVLCSSAIKKGFINPENYKIINSDFSSLEPRCFSFCSGDAKLKAIYKEGLDLYSKVYCDMEDKEGKYSADPKAPNYLKKLAPEKRAEVKPVVLSIPYGSRAPQVANLMSYKKVAVIRGKAKQVLDVDKGREFRDKYLKTYDKLHDYMILQEAKANADGFVETLVGRRRHFEFTQLVFSLLNESNIHYEEFLDEKTSNLQGKQTYKGLLNKENLQKLFKILGISNFDSKKNTLRDWAFIRHMYKNELNNAKNFPIQGLAAHVTNRAMLDMTREFRKQNLDAQICMQVHDEITIYCKSDIVDEVVPIVKNAMESNIYAKMLDVPMQADPLVCDNLKDSK